LIRYLAAEARRVTTTLTLGTAAVGVLAVASPHHRRCGLELAQRYVEAARSALAY